jgi:hypothetical protein
MLDVMAGRLGVVTLRLQGVAVRGVRVVRRLLVVSGFMMLGGFAMVVSGLVVMVGALMCRHGYVLPRARRMCDLCASARGETE